MEHSQAVVWRQAGGLVCQGGVDIKNFQPVHCSDATGVKAKGKESGIQNGYPTVKSEIPEFLFLFLHSC